MRHAAYEKKKQLYKTKIYQRQRELLDWFEELKPPISCVRCGFHHPGAIQFHHRDPRQKDMEIYAAVRKGWGKERILQELEKCEPLCANCHFILHWEERRASQYQ